MKQGFNHCHGAHGSTFDNEALIRLCFLIAGSKAQLRTERTINHRHFHYRNAHFVLGSGPIKGIPMAAAI